MNQMNKKPQKSQEAKPKYTFQEVQLDFIKYNLFLLVKAVCAQTVALSQGLKDPKDIAIEANRLLSYLDPNLNPAGKEENE